jgi:protein-histidine N-methyltransferase
MSAFTFDFDLEDDLDESFDAIPPHSTIDSSECGVAPSRSEELPAEEIPLSALVRCPALSPPLFSSTEKS